MSEMSGEALDQAAEGVELQEMLTALLDLELSVRHTRWNCYGAGFRDLRLHLRSLVEVVRLNSDALAERALTTGVSPDVRVATIVAGSALPVLQRGPTLVDVATAEVADVVGQVVSICRRHLVSLNDPVTGALVVSTVAALEHHRWQLLAEFSSQPPARPMFDAV